MLSNSANFKGFFFALFAKAWLPHDCLCSLWFAFWIVQKCLTFPLQDCSREHRLREFNYSCVIPDWYFRRFLISSILETIMIYYGNTGNFLWKIRISTRFYIWLCRPVKVRIPTFKVRNLKKNSKIKFLYFLLKNIYNESFP